MAVRLTVAGDVFDGVLFALSFSHDMSWMRSGPELRQFPRTALPTLVLNGFPLHGKQTGNLISRSPSKKVLQ